MESGGSMSWQPIETAPVKPFDPDRWWEPGERVLLVINRCVVIGRYEYTKTGKGRWVVHGWPKMEPACWQPLPEPPADQSSGMPKGGEL
jgi:hypothetical protein